MASSIQLLRSTNPQERPFAGNLLEGQPAANLHSSEPGLFFKTTDGSVVKFGPAAITSDGSPPNSAPQGSAGNSVGELWLDKSLNPPVLRVYDGAQWVDAGSGGGGGGGGSGSFTRWIYIASGGETSLSGISGGVLLEYTAGLEEVYVNGVLITRGTDYSAINGTSITNLAPLAVGDVVTVLSMNPLETIELPGQVTLLRWTILAAAGQTVLSGVDSSSQQLAYTAGFEEVYVNGAFLRRGIDYTATNDVNITLSSPLSLDDEVTVLAWSAFEIGRFVVDTQNIVDGAVTNDKLQDDIDPNKIFFKQDAPGSAPLTANDKLKEVISVKDFGAKGDGIQDDTDAINAALAAAPAVFFPAGTYLTNGEHNLKGKAIYGVSYHASKIKLAGVNTNVSLFTNGENINTPWGQGDKCLIKDLYLEGNWDGSTKNTLTDISDICALVKWWSGAYVQIERCRFTRSFGFGFFSYKLGYSYINTTYVATNAKNGIHLQAPNGNQAITTTTINNCSVLSCRGRDVDPNTGGSGICVINGFYVAVNGSIIEDVDDAIRIGGNDNRSITVLETHMESVYNSCINYVGSGTDLMLFQNVFATQPALLQWNPQFTTYQSIGCFGLSNAVSLKSVSDGPYQVAIDSSSPKAVIASVTISQGTWTLTGNWSGIHSAGTGIVSPSQSYAISDSPSIPGFSIFYNSAVTRGEITSPVNQFVPLQTTLSLTISVTSDTTMYLYGGPDSISGNLSCVLIGSLKAVRVNDPYLS